VNWKLLLLAVAVYLLFMRKRRMSTAPQDQSAAGQVGDFNKHNELLPVDERHMGTVPEYYFLNGEGPTASA